MHAKFNAHLILIDFITLITFYEGKIYEAPYYAVFSRLSPTSFLLDPNIFLSTLFSNMVYLIQYKFTLQLSPVIIQ
jgi:hypothetical protein